MIIGIFIAFVVGCVGVFIWRLMLGIREMEMSNQRDRESGD